MPSEEKRQRIGLFGGTFDPIHVGHLLLAETAREKLVLDEVRFLPAATSPLKVDRSTGADVKQRLEMVGLAINANPHFVLDDREARRGGTSYTMDTLTELREELPTADLFLLIGADSLVDFNRWKSPSQICQLAFVAVLARGGHTPPDVELLKPHLPEDQRAQADQHMLQMPQLEISSTDLRSRISNGMSTRYQLPAAIEAYVAANSLYANSQT